MARCLAIPYYHLNTNRCWNIPAVSEGRVYVRSTLYAAVFDFSMPDLKLDPPRLMATNKFQLTIRTVNGTPVNSNRLAGMEARATTNLSQALTQWLRLTNSLVLTNGVIRIDDVDAATRPRRFFNVSEPN